MITIVAKAKVKRDNLDEFKALARELIEESRKEAGCISYHLHQSINDETVLTFIEEWADQETIERHNKSAHFTTIVPKLGALQEKATEVDLYTRI